MNQVDAEELATKVEADVLQAVIEGRYDELLAELEEGPAEPVTAEHFLAPPTNAQAPP